MGGLIVDFLDHQAAFYPSTFVYSCFFPKIEFFLLFTKSVNLDLQIVGKCTSDTFLTSKYTLSIADKHHFPLEYYGLVIKCKSISSAILVRKSR